MSDDLISRKALKNEIIEYRKQFPIGSSERILVSTVIGFINTAPKAFDKEKVLKELAFLKEDAVRHEINDFADAYELAIEVVEIG